MLNILSPPATWSPNFLLKIGKATDYLTCNSCHCASKPILQQQVVQRYKVTSLCLKTQSQVIKMSNKFAGNLQGRLFLIHCPQTTLLGQNVEHEKDKFIWE